MTAEASNPDGYVLEIFDGSAWVTQDGKITFDREKRGVWPTAEAAEEMMQRCLNFDVRPNEKGEP